MTNSPRHLGKVRLAVPGPVGGTTIGVEVQTMSQRLTVARSLVGGHALANVNYVHPITARLAFTATLRNLFDVDDSDPASAEHRQDVIPQDGRTGYVGLRWNWAR